MKAVLAAASLLAIACATVPREDGDRTGPCRITGLENLVGRAASDELGAEALRRSGARTLRRIRPGDIVTMDYREDRLNIRLDARNRVEGFSCG